MNQIRIRLSQSLGKRFHCYTDYLLHCIDVYDTMKRKCVLHLTLWLNGTAKVLVYKDGEPIRWPLTRELELSDPRLLEHIDNIARCLRYTEDSV